MSALFPMWHNWFVGNDVVDLESPRCRGKAGDRRFLARVFSPQEQREIEGSTDPDTAIWARWAAKEAAFKSISRLLGSAPVFNHRGFQVHLALEAPHGPGTPSAGEVRYQDLALPVRVHSAEEALHAITWIPHPEGIPPPVYLGLAAAGSPRSDWRAFLRSRFSPREWECISHHASAVARLEARRSVASALGADENLVEIGCRPGSAGHRPPVVFVGGQEGVVDLSLSHHGRLVGWAFTLIRQLGDDGKAETGSDQRAQGR